MKATLITPHYSGLADPTREGIEIVGLTELQARYLSVGETFTVKDLAQIEWKSTYKVVEKHTDFTGSEPTVTLGVAKRNSSDPRRLDEVYGAW